MNPLKDVGNAAKDAALKKVGDSPIGDAAREGAKKAVENSTAEIVEQNTAETNRVKGNLAPEENP